MLAPKVALITGSAKRRIGRHVADALADRGYAIVIHYRRSKAEAEEAVADFRAKNVPALALQADFSDDSSIACMIAQTLSKFGRLDVLVNCAADWRPKKLEEVTA